jgi:2-polyprenyl-3-methyl-5-hydroxy-6-metoxy-1,4-benzoquinol methylase
MELQRQFWNGWNSTHREVANPENRTVNLSDTSTDQAKTLLGWIKGFGRKDLRILDAGCGAGWLCEMLTDYGSVTGVDLSDEVLSRAQKRLPEVTFIAGNLMDLDLEKEAYDVVISLEVLSHVADQPAFITKLASLTAPGGRLILATQNKPVLKRNQNIDPVKPGQLRRWVDSRELRELLKPHFTVTKLRSLTPKGNLGFLRFVNSYKVNEILRLLTGNGGTRVKEFLGLGFSLIVLAEKR